MSRGFLHNYRKQLQKPFRVNVNLVTLFHKEQVWKLRNKEFHLRNFTNIFSKTISAEIEKIV